MTLITKKSISEAPMFTVFRGARPVAQRDCPFPRLWDVFGGGPGYTDAVEEELERRGLEVGEHHIERCDQECSAIEQMADDPQPYDDFDAAIDALNAGYTLVKVPDAMTGEKAQYYYMYVLHADVKRETKPTIWHAPSTVIDDPLYHAFEHTGTTDMNMLVFKSACGDHVIHTKRRLSSTATRGSRKCSKCRVEVE
jgi:hypothetical protein